MIEYRTRGEFMEDKYYSQIKDLIVDTETTIKVKDYSKNKKILDNNYEIGKILVEAQGGESRAKYGDKLILKYSRKLTKELGKGYSTRTLKDMRKFYLFQKRHALRAQLSWTNYRELLSLKDDNEIEYYMGLAIKNNLTYRQLHEKINLMNTKNYLSIQNKN